MRTAIIYFDGREITRVTNFDYVKYYDEFVLFNKEKPKDKDGFDYETVGYFPVSYAFHIYDDNGVCQSVQN